MNSTSVSPSSAMRPWLTLAFMSLMLFPFALSAEEKKVNPSSNTSTRPKAKSTMIRHTVVFNLKHAAGSDEERAFLDAALELAKIPSVRQFERLREVSPKNKFSFGLSMEFDDAAGYEAYNVHPDHVRFVQEIWIPQVTDFMEIDYEIYP